MINILLVDDHKIIRDGISAFIKEEKDMKVIGEAGSGREMLDVLAANVQPDVILMDINMPEMDGYEATKAIKEQFPEIKIMVLSMLDHEKYVQKMMDAGASGYTLKNTGKNELLFGIRTVASGNKFICTDVALNFLSKLQHGPTGNHQPNNHEKKHSDLSQREIEVLKLIAEGLTNAEIADKLFTSKRTIESHRQNIIEKTQVKNTASLIKFAITQGIIQ